MDYQVTLIDLILEFLKEYYEIIDFKKVTKSINPMHPPAKTVLASIEEDWARICNSNRAIFDIYCNNSTLIVFEHGEVNGLKSVFDRKWIRMHDNNAFEILINTLEEIDG